MRRNFTPVAIGAACALTFATEAAAQRATDTDVEALRKRVEQLEAANAQASPGLSYQTGGNTTVQIYGFVRAEFFYDFDFEQGDLSLTSVIGEPGAATDGAFNTSVRVSRLGVRSTTQTDIGQIGTQLEFDLFASGGTTELRLRHANVTFGDSWLVGQFWTNFMPLGQYPRTSDFNGPVGITFARLPQIRYTGRPSDQFQYSFSLEENFDGASQAPVFTAAAQYATDNYALRGAVLAGQTVSGGNSIDQRGLTLSGSFTPWQGGLISATAVTGQGIGGLLIGGGANGVGGQVNDVTGYTLEFRQDIGSKWNVGIAYGRENYDLPTSTATLDFTRLQSLHLNAFYSPTDNLDIGVEYIRGQRTTSSGQTFDADRIGASVTFSF